MVKNLVQGNEAVVLASMKAGLGFYAGYPITPASEIIHYFAKSKVNMMLMEDEIASIHAVIGASLAGKKAMTATSGPGFSLMQEGIGLAHMTEVPCVIVDVQRQGPSTGMPTLPAQGDIIQSRFGSHGDYFPIVLYPNSIPEIYKYTIEAFNAAEESLSPVILLTDGYISHLYETLDESKIKFKLIERKKAPFGSDHRHFTGLVHKDMKPASTDEYAAREIIKKLKEKQEKVAKNYNYYEYLENKNSDTLLISMGAVSRAAYNFKDKYGLFRPIRIFPAIEELKKIADAYKNIIVMEMNMGQYAQEVERLLKRPVTQIPIIGGKIRLNEIREQLEGIREPK